MPTSAGKASGFLNRHHLDGADIESLAKRLRSNDAPPSPRVPGGARLTPEAVEKRWALVKASGDDKGLVADPQTLAAMEAYQHNIENFIGTVKVPVGLAGPLRVNGLFAKGDYYLPLATTEAALVASYHPRGVHNQPGGGLHGNAGERRGEPCPRLCVSDP